MSDTTLRDLVGCTVARERADAAELDAATTWAQVRGKRGAGQEALAISTKPQVICLQAYPMDRDLRGSVPARPPTSSCHRLLGSQ